MDIYLVVVWLAKEERGEGWHWIGGKESCDIARGRNLSHEPQKRNRWLQQGREIKILSGMQNLTLNTQNLSICHQNGTPLTNTTNRRDPFCPSVSKMLWMSVTWLSTPCTHAIKKKKAENTIDPPKSKPFSHFPTIAERLLDEMRYYVYRPTQWGPRAATK